MDALIKALDDCLEKMQSGVGLEEVLADYPELKNELRPLLETAAAAKTLRYPGPVSLSSLSLSRAKFLKQADTLRESHNHFTWGNPLRSSAALIYIVIIFCVLALGTEIASAQSIPGDILYPVKLASEQTRLLLDNNPASRLQLQESFDHQHAQDIDRLMQQERSLEISFAGFLSLKERDQWTVDGISVVFPQNLLTQAEQMRGEYIEVKGLPQSSGTFLVEDIHVRQFNITGTIEAVQPMQWTVSQLLVAVTPDTVINGQPAIGATAKLVVMRIANDQLQALQINVIMATKMDTSTPLPQEENPTQNSPASGENGDNHRENTPQSDKTSPAEKETARPTTQGDDNHHETRTPQDNLFNPTHPPTATLAPQSGEGGRPHTTPTPTPQSGSDGGHHTDSSSRSRPTPTQNTDSGGSVTNTPHPDD